ncbi:hypothetical protein CMV_019045 [Castanea mollissima]|uniref:Uncharacterized protein n=1 Tax=Castanea mollissima TaxID=60419 RepID=A0A8J4R2A9_9ROSI|nr:hypothetical protein CMV_019045 [Castanea mollissima]
MATAHDLNDNKSILKKRLTLEIELPDKDQKLPIKPLDDQKMPCPNDFEQGGMLEPSENVHELKHEHLKEVHLAELYDAPSQINFSIYFIKHACALKQLVIDPTVLGIPKKFGVRLPSYAEQRENIGKKLREKLQEFSKDAVLII